MLIKIVWGVYYLPGVKCRNWKCVRNILYSDGIHLLVWGKLKYVSLLIIIVHSLRKLFVCSLIVIHYYWYLIFYHLLNILHVSLDFFQSTTGRLLQASVLLLGICFLSVFLFSTKWPVLTTSSWAKTKVWQTIILLRADFGLQFGSRLCSWVSGHPESIWVWSKHRDRRWSRLGFLTSNCYSYFELMLPSVLLF